MPHAVEGWVHEIWRWSPALWIYQLYYLQYLCLVIPGTIAGDLILKWIQNSGPITHAAEKTWPARRMISIGVLMFSFVLVLLVGLKARWLVSTTLLVFADRKSVV